ncbi:hypothetical protein [Streptomyces sp. NPDC088730]|uniref:hypothetical protein n=1 Tax=Streptomyces sp. NPDC088730 TaxID=3365877 RepID=UPI0037FD0741
MVMGRATKKYTVTLPEEPAEEIRAEVGPGAFSAYVTRAIERQREHDRLEELVGRLEVEYGPVTDADPSAAESGRRGKDSHRSGIRVVTSAMTLAEVTPPSR